MSPIRLRRLTHHPIKPATFTHFRSCTRMVGGVNVATMSTQTCHWEYRQSAMKEFNSGLTFFQNYDPRGLLFRETQVRPH